jgi:hypothetical protein
VTVATLVARNPIEAVVAPVRRMESGIRRSVLCWCVCQEYEFSCREDVLLFIYFVTKFYKFCISLRFAKTVLQWIILLFNRKRFIPVNFDGSYARLVIQDEVGGTCSTHGGTYVNGVGILIIKVTKKHSGDPGLYNNKNVLTKFRYNLGISGGLLSFFYITELTQYMNAFLDFQLLKVRRPTFCRTHQCVILNWMRPHRFFSFVSALTNVVTLLFETHWAKTTFYLILELLNPKLFTNCWKQNA